MEYLHSFAPIILAVIAFITFRIIKARRSWMDYTAREIYVIDGDTINLYRNSDCLKIRCKGFDAPEMGQAGGQEAKDFLKELAKSGFSIQFHEADVYGRVLADIKTSKGRLSSVMLSAGHAHDTSLSALTRLIKTLPARIAGRGLWSGSLLGIGVTRPSDWRKTNPIR